VRVWRTRIPSLALCGAARLQSPRHYPGILRPIPRLRALEEFPSLRRPCVIFHSLIARVADLLQIAALMQRSKPGTCGSVGPAGSSPSVRMYCVCVRNGEPVVSFPSPAIPPSRRSTLAAHLASCCGAQVQRAEPRHHTSVRIGRCKGKQPLVGKQASKRSTNLTRVVSRRNCTQQSRRCTPTFADSMPRCAQAV
jgi:hypothetical protein